MEKQSVVLSSGNRIAYLERAGEGRPVVLLHGITEDAQTYAPLFEKIDPDCHVFALDFRGHGDSDRPDSTYSTAAYAEDVIGFIDEKIGKPVILGGHSLGGLVSIQVAVTAPQLVSRLFLEDPPIYFVGRLDDIYQALFAGIIMMAKSIQDGSRSRDDWFNVMSITPDPYTGKPGIEMMGEAMLRRRVTSIGKMNPRALEDALHHASLVWDADEVLTRVQCPVLLLAGDAAMGSVMSADEAERAQAIISDCELVTVDGVGHMIHDMKPDVWLESLNRCCGAEGR